MRKSPDFDLYCDSIMKQAFGVIKWKSKVVQMEISKFVKPSFEAFCLLAYDNCYSAYVKDKSTEEVTNQDIDTRPNRTRKKFKYTSDSRLAGRNKGWPGEAINLYNELFEKVKKDRVENCGWDVSYKLRKIKATLQKKLNQKKI
jgi:hypothetical protein